jgi:hypothetical protein
MEREALSQEREIALKTRLTEMEDQQRSDAARMVLVFFRLSHPTHGQQEAQETRLAAMRKELDALMEALETMQVQTMSVTRELV